MLYTYALENASSAIYIKDALSYYLIDRPGNSMSTFKDKTFYDHYVIMSELFNYAHDGNNKMLYARTYIQFRYALSQLVEHGADSAKLKYFNEYWNIYKTLIRHKKDVMNNYPKDGTLSKLKCAFLLSGLFEKTMLKDLMGERMALNTPVQGSASDILKKAMIEIDEIFEKENIKSKMLLQVHDELIFNVYDDEIDKVKEIVYNTMTNVFDLKVPLDVDIELGNNWYEAK